MKINTDIDIFSAQQETASGYKQHFGGFIDAILAIILFFRFIICHTCIYSCTPAETYAA